MKSQRIFTYRLLQTTYIKNIRMMCQTFLQNKIYMVPAEGFLSPSPIT